MWSGEVARRIDENKAVFLPNFIKASLYKNKMDNTPKITEGTLKETSEKPKIKLHHLRIR